MPKTGEWLRKSEKFTQWKNEGSTALWVNGTPGTGKSVVAATLIRDFVEMEDAPVLYFFFRHANLANRTPQQLTRDWLSQLLLYSPLLQSLLKKLMEEQPKNEDVTFDRLWGCLCSAASSVPKISCVADALDEMEKSNDWFLPKLIELGQQKPSTLKVVVTSRQSPHIEAVFKEGLVIDINLNRRLIDQDIATYVEHLLRHTPKLGINSEGKKLIISTIQEKASGLFLYASLMMEEVLRNLRHQSIEKLLSDLPTGVDGMYTTLLNEHSARSGVSHDIQKLILQWVTHAFRPLRLLEVADIVRTTDEGIALGGIQEVKNIVRTACGPLLTILPDETLQVIHHSFTEFLVADTRLISATGNNSYPVFDSTAIHCTAATTCLGYLGACSLSATDKKGDGQDVVYNQAISRGTRDDLLVEHPLLQYTTTYWMVHASRNGGCSSPLLRAIRDFFDLKRKAFSFWQGVWRSAEPRATHAVLQPLHTIALFGLSSIMGVYLHTAMVDARDSDGREPLSYASERGDIASANLLLAHGASIKAQNKYSIASIHYACSANQPAMVKRLLQAGADPLLKTLDPVKRPRTGEEQEVDRCRRRFGINPLHLACANGYIECLQELLKWIDPPILLEGPLHWASENGQAEIVRLLLSTGHVVPDRKSAEGNTPLGLAAYKGSPSTVKVLLDAGVDIEAKSSGIDRTYGLSNCLRKKGDVNELTALHAWACNGRYGSTLEEFVNTGILLLEAGCSPHARDTEGKIPLFRWSKFYNLEWATAFSKVLIERGQSDASARDNYGNTPLHSLTSRHTDAHIGFLLSGGGNFNSHRTWDGQTPLMCTFGHWTDKKREDWHEFVEKYDVIPNAQSSDGKTVLHMALASDAWTVSKVKHWLEAGADPTIEDSRGQNCLFNLKLSKDAEVAEDTLIDLLEDAGVDLNARDHEGRNVPLAAIGWANLDVLEKLESYGFDLTATDHQGRTALHILSSLSVSHHSVSPHDHQNRLEYLNFLLDTGLDPNTQDYAGNTMLHYAVKNTGPFLRTARYLLDTALEVGAKASICNHKGRSLLHIAAALPIERYDYHGCDSEKRLVYLLSPRFGLDVNLADHDGITPLHFAATNADSRVSDLLSAGAYFGAVDHCKRTVLHYAARGGNSNALGLITKILVSNGLQALIDKPDHNGRTPLHDAVRSGVLESVEILLAAFSDPNARDFGGKTCFHIVSECNEERHLMELQRSSQQQYQGDRNRYPPDVWKRRYASHPAFLQVKDDSRPVYETKRQRKKNKKASRLDLEGMSRIPDIIRLLMQSPKSIRPEMFDGRNICRELPQPGFREDLAVDPSARDDDGMTPYDVAIATGCKEAAQTLASTSELDEGTMLNGKSHFSVESTILAKQKKLSWRLEDEAQTQVMNEAVTNPEEATLHLILTLRNGNNHVIQRLLELGADPLTSLPDGKTLLHEIARNGLVSVMKQLVHGLDVQSLPTDLLHEAARRERPNIAIIKFLVQLGMDVNATRFKNNRYGKDDGFTAVHLLSVAKHWWNLIALDYLLTHGADPEFPTSNGRTALQIAIKGRASHWDQPGCFRPESIAILLKHNAKVNYVNSAGSTPLVDSFDEGIETVRILLQHGADVSFGDEPPIRSAVASLDVAVVEAMVEAGADCNAMCPPSRTDNPREPLLVQIAAADFRGGKRYEFEETMKANAERIIHLLLEGGADPNKTMEDGTPLIIAIIRKRGILKPFLSLALDLESKDSSGMTAFLVACAQKSLTAVNLLIEAGADTAAIDGKSRNALHWVAKVSSMYSYDDVYIKIADILVSYGITVNELDDEGFSPLHCALKEKSHEMMVLLLNAGADAAVPYPNSQGYTNLHCILPLMAQDGSCRYQKHFIPLAQRFIDAGADREARDHEGNTPIFGYVAVKPTYDDDDDRMNEYPDLEEQRKVLSGFNLTVRNNDGQTLMHIVAKRGREIEGLPTGRDDTRDMFKLLWELGCDPKAEDGLQRTPLDVAAACGNRGILDLFAPVEVG